MFASPRSAAIIVIAVGTLLRFFWAYSLDALNDEAYHWQFVLHPALSYFDHPPMTAWVAHAGIAACGGWVHPLSLRLGFVLLFAGSCGVLFKWTARWFGEPAGFWAVVGLSLSHYYTAFGGMLAVPDSPLLFFALFTFWQLGGAVGCDAAGRPPQRLGRWLLVGLGLGGAMMSKYHAVLIPVAVVVYALVTPGRRRLLRSPGPWLAVLVAMAVFSPVLIWNSAHEWASFKFQGGRATEAGGLLIHEGPLKWLFGPMLFLLPWFWFWLLLALLARLRRFRALGGIERLIAVLSVVPLVFFLITSSLSPTALPHWALIGYIPLFPLAGDTWARLSQRRKTWFKPMVGFWILAEAVLLIGIYAHAAAGIVPLPAGAVDESRQFSGWPSVAAGLEERGFLDDPDTFLFTTHWETSGQLVFAVRNRIPVACYHSFDARGFAFWSKPEDYLGRTGYLVLLDEAGEAETRGHFARYFTAMTLVAEFPMTRASGRFFRRVKVYRCENQRMAYPFDYTDRGK